MCAPTGAGGAGAIRMAKGGVGVVGVIRLVKGGAGGVGAIRLSRGGGGPRFYEGPRKERWYPCALSAYTPMR
jgi:hypothetical protein